VEEIDPDLVGRGERRLARLLPVLEALEGPLRRHEELEARRDEEQGQGQADQGLDQGEAARAHGLNPRSREI
jgi:hypothetical protein